MAIQDIIGLSEHRYTVRGWRDGYGDPSLDVEIRATNYDTSLLPVVDLVEGIRDAFLTVPEIETVEVRQHNFSASETVVPAP